MSNHFSSEHRDRIWGGSAMCPECPRDDWWGSKSCCLQPRERCPDPSGVTTFPSKWSDYISGLDWSGLGVEPAEAIWDCYLPSGIASLQGLLAPRPSPWGKADFKQGRIQPVKLGGVISAIFGSQVDTSWKCCDKTMDDRMALNREWCFPNCKISRWKVSFVGFRGVIAPIAPLGSGPGMKMN